MKREEILPLLRQAKIVDSIKDGPTAILVSSRGKWISIVISQKGNNTISASVGRFFKRRFTFHPNELQ